MTVVENEVRALVDKELVASVERFPMFSSPYEGYAVMLKEVEKASEDAKRCELYVNHVWSFVRDDTNADERAAALYRMSVKCACEMIQLAVVARKFIGVGESS